MHPFIELMLRITILNRYHAYRTNKPNKSSNNNNSLSILLEIDFQTFHIRPTWALSVIITFFVRNKWMQRKKYLLFERLWLGRRTYNFICSKTKWEKKLILENFKNDSFYLEWHDIRSNREREREREREKENERKRKREKKERVRESIRVIESELIKRTIF